MTIQTTYTQARANLAALFDAVSEDREIVIVQRRGAEDVAVIAADELASLLETKHLLQSPKNAALLPSRLTHCVRNPALMPTTSHNTG